MMSNTPRKKDMILDHMPFWIIISLAVFVMISEIYHDIYKMNNGIETPIFKDTE